MIKDVILNCAQLLDRDDLVDELNKIESIDEISEKYVQNDISKLLSYYNFIARLICESYIDLVREDEFISNSDKKIYFNNFLFKPIKILSAKSGNLKEYFQIFSDYIVVLKANARYKIEYKYVLDEAKDLNDSNCFCGILNKHILCEGIASQFLASKGRFNESEYWHNKFMCDLFKYKCKKDRRIKPSFIIWNKFIKIIFSQI